jgi:hypothetical protein
MRNLNGKTVVSSSSRFVPDEIVDTEAPIFAN